MCGFSICSVLFPSSYTLHQYFKYRGCFGDSGLGVTVQLTTVSNFLFLSLSGFIFARVYFNSQNVGCFEDLFYGSSPVPWTNKPGTWRCSGNTHFINTDPQVSLLRAVLISMSSSVVSQPLEPVQRESPQEYFKAKPILHFRFPLSVTESDIRNCYGKCPKEPLPLLKH